ncbi:MAG: phosphate acyltransferase PlsX [Candidatus Cloacimonetes bacterium]|nr:phosphate acyltransferase PlsX [Candidatus Cloacimonadota bacterium]
MAVVLDAMGGDFAPSAIVEGAILAARSGIKVYLVGTREALSPLESKPETGIELVYASEVVGMAESPAEALRKKIDSSIAVGVRLAKEKQVPFVSAGNTGACMAAALFVFGRIPGIKRPPIASVFPQTNGKKTVVLDVGANVDCQPESLLQFAVIGDAWAKAMLGIQNPTIGLLSNGSEREKGNALVHEAHEILSKSKLNFIGNVEGFDALAGRCDVIVTDGFAGNILLKAIEGVAHLFGHMIETNLPKDKKPAEEYLNLIQATKAYNPSAPEHCGAPLLGVNGHCYIVHGNADAKVIFGACQTSVKLGQSNLLELIQAGVRG